MPHQRETLEPTDALQRSTSGSGPEVKKDAPSMRMVAPLIDSGQFRFLPDYVDITKRYQVLTDLGFTSVDLPKTYSDYWEGDDMPPAIPLAVNTDVVGADSNVTKATFLQPGLQSSIPGTNTGFRTDTRSALLVDADGGVLRMLKLKGVGLRLVIEDGHSFLNSKKSKDLIISILTGSFISQGRNPQDQFGLNSEEYITGRRFSLVEKEELPYNGWNSWGGVLEKVACSTFLVGYAYLELFRRCFNRDPLILLPKRVFDITPALKKEGFEVLDHAQVSYELRTQVRTFFSSLIADLAYLWRDIDLSASGAVATATNTLNYVLSAYPKMYADQDLVLLTEDDVAQAFACAQKLQDLYVGERSLESSSLPDLQVVNDKDQDIAGDSLSHEEMESIALIKEELRTEGISLARLFFERNQEIVEKTIEEEMNGLADNIGFSLAMGIDLGQSISSKDTYGGQIADLDSIDFAVFDDSLFKPLDHFAKTFFDFTSMLGCDGHSREKLFINFINRISEAFGQTLSQLDQMGLLESYVKQILSFIVEQYRREEKFPRAGLILLKAISIANKNKLEELIGRSLPTIDISLSPFFYLERPLGTAPAKAMPDLDPTRLGISMCVFHPDENGKIDIDFAKNWDSF